MSCQETGTRRAGVLPLPGPPSPPSSPRSVTGNAMFLLSRRDSRIGDAASLRRPGQAPGNAEGKQWTQGMTDAWQGPIPTFSPPRPNASPRPRSDHSVWLDSSGPSPGFSCPLGEDFLAFARTGGRWAGALNVNSSASQAVIGYGPPALCRSLSPSSSVPGRESRLDVGATEPTFGTRKSAGGAISPFHSLPLLSFIFGARSAGVIRPHPMAPG